MNCKSKTPSPDPSACVCLTYSALTLSWTLDPLSIFDNARLVMENGEHNGRSMSHSSHHPVATATNEITPLLRLHNVDGVESRPSSFARIKSILSAQNQPSYAQSFRFFLFGTWWNILLVFIPLSFVSHHLNWDAGLRFGFSFMAIMPLAQVCTWYSIAV